MIECKSVCPDSINSRFINAHGGIPERVKEKCQKIAVLLETNAAACRPMPGDFIIANGYSNHKKTPVRYENGHIEDIDAKGNCNCCTEPYIPFVDEAGTMDTSGGYWFGANVKELTHVGTREKTFKTWASHPCADGAVHFTATVNVWEYTNNDKIY